jgi:predicted  nucleic acid-binding Zn-ribbon protein
MIYAVATADIVGWTASMAAIAAAILGFTKIIHLLKEQQRQSFEQDRAMVWVQAQMKANGGTLRTGSDDLMKAIRDVRSEIAQLRAQVTILQSAHERIEVNQREQGKAAAADRRNLDDHLLEAADAINRLDGHIAEHDG